MAEIVQEIITGLVSGLTQMATGLGSGLNELIQNIFLKMGDSGIIEGLSTTGIVIIAFGGVALAVGLSKFVVKWLMSWGARK